MAESPAPPEKRPPDTAKATADAAKAAAKAEAAAKAKAAEAAAEAEAVRAAKAAEREAEAARAKAAEAAPEASAAETAAAGPFVPEPSQEEIHEAWLKGAIERDQRARKFLLRLSLGNWVVAIIAWSISAFLGITSPASLIVYSILFVIGLVAVCIALVTYLLEKFGHRPRLPDTGQTLPDGDATDAAAAAG